MIMHPFQFLNNSYRILIRIKKKNLIIVSAIVRACKMNKELEMFTNA